MSQTTNGLRYPQNTDQANIATDIANLASDVQDYFLPKAPTTLANATITKNFPSIVLDAPSTEPGIRFKATGGGTDAKHWGLYVGLDANGPLRMRGYTDALAQQPDYISFYRDGRIGATGTPTNATDLTTKAYVDYMLKTPYSGYLVQWGQHTFGTISVVASGNANAAVTFPNSFGSSPIVFASLGGAPAGTGNLVPRGINPTTTGFSAYVYNPGSTTQGSTGLLFNWLAIGAA